MYGHCRASHDLDAMWADSHQLRQAADSLRAQQLLQILPEVLEKVLEKLPSRWSVDPDAMAADCSLRAGLIAQEKGRPRLAQALFRLVAMTYAVDRYAYYIEQASQQLQEYERIADAPERVFMSAAKTRQRMFRASELAPRTNRDWMNEANDQQSGRVQDIGDGL